MTVEQLRVKVAESVLENIQNDANVGNLFGEKGKVKITFTTLKNGKEKMTVTVS